MSGPRTQLYTGKPRPFAVWLNSGNWRDFEPRWVGADVDQFVSGNLMTSTGHQVSLLGKTMDDIGGNFAVSKRKYSETSSMGDSPHHFSAHHEYGNPYYAPPMADGVTHHFFAPRASRHVVTESSFWYPWEGVNASSEFELNALGTTAISRIVPTSPVWSAAAFVGELREGLPKFGIQSWKDRTHLARSAGGDYLNYQFGWKPLVADIKGFANTVRNAHAISAKYEADAGQLLHRRYDWPNEFDTYFGEYTGAYPAYLWDTDLFRPDHIGRMRIYGKAKTRRWLKATFTYYLPPVGTAARDLAIANHLYGVKLTPDVVWELTPWSWAADWVTNIGDVAKNLSAFATDGLVMPHAYIMEETSLEVRYALDQVGFKSYPGYQHFSQTFNETVKTRRRATPFGFGLDEDGFTPRQLAILASLGITRRK